MIITIILVLRGCAAQPAGGPRVFGTEEPVSFTYTFTFTFTYVLSFWFIYISIYTCIFIVILVLLFLLFMCIWCAIAKMCTRLVSNSAPTWSSRCFCYRLSFLIRQIFRKECKYNRAQLETSPIRNEPNWK